MTSFYSSEDCVISLTPINIVSSNARLAYLKDLACLLLQRMGRVRRMGYPLYRCKIGFLEVGFLTSRNTFSFIGPVL